MPSKNKIVILHFHPLLHKSRVNRVLLNAVKGIEGVNIRHMYDLYPDYHIDIKKEQEILLQHDIIVWQHPFYWYSSPSLMKEWIDLVLEHGFAYGREGLALEGKMIMSAISTGGRRETYTAEDRVKYSIPQLLAPFEQTVGLCRMNYLPPFVTHGTHLLNGEQISTAGEHYGRVIRALAEGNINKEAILKGEYMNDIIP